ANGTSFTGTFILSALWPPGRMKFAVTVTCWSSAMGAGAAAALSAEAVAANAQQHAGPRMSAAARPFLTVIRFPPPRLGDAAGVQPYWRRGDHPGDNPFELGAAGAMQSWAAQFRII